MIEQAGKEVDSFGRIIPKGSKSPESDDDRRGNKRGRSDSPNGSGNQKRRKGGPRLDGPMLSLKEFTAQSDALSVAALGAAYDTYIRDYSKANGRRFFDQHREEDWFTERYESVRLTNRNWALNGTAALERYTAFVRDFKNNRRIPHIDLDVPSTDGKAPAKDEFYDNCVLLGFVDKTVSRAQLLELFTKVSGFRKLLLNSADPYVLSPSVSWCVGVCV